MNISDVYREEILNERGVETGTVSIIERGGEVFIRKGEKMKEICRFIMPTSQRTR